MEKNILILTLGLLQLLTTKSCGCHQTMERAFANVSLLLARHHSVDCLQIFTSEYQTEEAKRRIRLTMKELTSVEAGLTTGIYTFQQYIRRKSVKSLKVSCYKPMKVMFDDEETKKGFAELSHRIPLVGSVWILFIQSSISDFFRSANLPFDVELIVAEAESTDSILFQEVYRVSDEFPLKVKYYGKWNKNEQLQVINGLIYNRRNDLEGIKVKTGSIENWPTSTYKHGTEWDGYFPLIWKELTELINCTTENFKSVDGVTGTQDENGTWNGLVGMALRGEIDVIVSELTLDKARTKVLYHFHPLLSSSYQIYIRSQGFNLEWASVFKPFAKSIWIGIAVWLLAGALAMSICYRFSLLYGFEHDREHKFDFIRSAFFMLQTICQQGHYTVPRSACCRIVFFTAYMASAILIPSYSASIISSLTQQTPYRPFNDLEEMLRDGSYRLLVKSDTAEHAFFSHSKSELLEKVYEKLIKTVPREREMINTSQALKTICNVPRYALFGIEAVQTLRFATILKPDCPLITLTRPLAKVYLTMGTPHGHPYAGLIDHYLYKLIDAGVTKRIERAVWPVIDKGVQHTDNQVHSEDVFQGFVMTAFFIIVSLTILVIERFYYQRTRKQKIQKQTVLFEKRKSRNWYLQIDMYM